MKANPIKKYALPAGIIVVGGFILFNLAFILTALVVNLLLAVEGNPESSILHIVGRLLALLLILVIIGLILRTRINHTVKATFMTMPLMTILVLLGITFYGQPLWVLYGVGAAIILAVLFFLYKRKLPWVYYFATLFVAALGIFIMATGMDI